MGKKIAILSILIGAFGVLMVYSASQVWADYKQGNEYFFLIRQLIFYLLGVVVFITFSKIKPNLFYKYSNHIFIASIILLVLVLIPGIGIVRGGARSWIGIASFSIQPSELSKIAVIIIIAKYLSMNFGKTTELKYLIPPLLIVGTVFGLIMLEPDFGTGAILVCTILVMLMISGIKRQYYYFGILGGVAAVVILVLSAPYRLERIFAFLDPFSDPLGGGFQIIQSLYAIVPAGLFGFGLFNSKQKYFYLPEPQTDIYIKL
ncbi:MAG: FtsW/RodA/SpoVE family cell cycle protein [bacterium]